MTVQSVAAFISVSTVSVLPLANLVHRCFARTQFKDIASIIGIGFGPIATVSVNFVSFGCIFRQTSRFVYQNIWMFCLLFSGYSDRRSMFCFYWIRVKHVCCVYYLKFKDSHSKPGLFPEMLMAANVDVTRTPSTIPFIKAWTRIMCSSFKFYTGNTRWRTVWEFPTQSCVSFISVHQADVTLEALSPP